ncbi:hypothetical protein [Pseudobutyrivibrio sp. YE44]|nr:hypothetical protein [Pseudobutyrivibrio sp. YE44]
MFRKIMFANVNGVVTSLCVWCGNQIPWVGGKPAKCPFCGKPV